MNGTQTVASATLGRSGLFIPAACTLIAQFMQHVFAAGYDPANLPQLRWHDPLFLFAFLKAVALALLVVHAARWLLARSGGGAGARADRALAAAIESDAGTWALAAANKLFLKALSRRCLHHVLPLFVLHVVAAKGIAHFEGALLPLASVDAFVVLALGLAAGHAVFLAHEEARTAGRRCRPLPDDRPTAARPSSPWRSRRAARAGCRERS